jgi:hypothetical protein
MKSNASYSITVSKVNIPSIDTQFLGNFEFRLGIPGLYFITGIRCVVSLFDTGTFVNSYPTFARGKLNASDGAYGVENHDMTRFADVILDDFDYNESNQTVTMFPINNTEAIDLGYGLQVKNDQEILCGIRTEFPGGGANKNLSLNLFLNVWNPQSEGGPEPMKGTLNVPSRRRPV